MSNDRLEQAGLNRAWVAASAALPIGWRLEGPTCTSEGLAPEPLAGMSRAAQR